MSWKEKGSTNTNERTFIIESSADLATLPECDTGSIAYTEDWTTIYQMGISGNWTQVGGETT